MIYVQYLVLYSSSMYNTVYVRRLRYNYCVYIYTVLLYINFIIVNYKYTLALFYFIYSRPYIFKTLSSLRFQPLSLFRTMRRNAPLVYSNILIYYKYQIVSTPVLQQGNKNKLLIIYQYQEYCTK